VEIGIEVMEGVDVTGTEEVEMVVAVASEEATGLGEVVDMAVVEEAAMVAVVDMEEEEAALRASSLAED